MSFLSRLFKRKTDEHPVVKADHIGDETPKPANITNDVFGYFKEVPDWINQSSGWGYTKEDALVVDTDNPNLGVHSECDRMYSLERVLTCHLPYLNPHGE